jgi:hypothetical protein
LAAAACSSGGGGGGGSAGTQGQELLKPDGSSYFYDTNRGGRSSRVHLVEMFWARLVDVHDVDASGNASLEPIFADFTINENIQTDGTNYRLETNPITQRTRLVILKQRGVPGAGPSFDSLLRFAASGFPPILPRNDDGSTGDQYSFLTRNATLVLRFDDLLDDTLEAQEALGSTVRVLAGYPPVTPFPCRKIFDRNHGGVIAGEFHSTRVLVDLTVSAAERASMVVPEPINTVGLPPSLTVSTDPNVSLRIATATDFGGGQFEFLRNLAGAPLSPFENGPVDRSKPTREIVRAMRAGNESDQNNGFLVDLNAPRVVGSWALQVDSALPDPQGDEGFDFLFDLRFTTLCRTAPEPGDVVSLGELSFEIRQPQAQPDVDGRVKNVRVRSLAGEPLEPGTSIVGNAQFLSTYSPNDPVPRGCWISFFPNPVTLPSSGIATDARVVVRFSEPMNPDAMTPFDTFTLVTGDTTAIVTPRNLIVGNITSTSDLKEFTFDPVLDLPHTANASETYTVRLTGPTDLAGNGLADALPFITFTMDIDEPTSLTGGTVLRFASLDELPPIGAADIRGQFFFDPEGQAIRPRPVSFASYPADRINPVPSIMVPFARGVQTPLSPLGSKLHAVWRYCDFGWQVLDETKYNLDVFGLSWAPIGGQVINDFFERFEILLAHSRRLPDEALNGTFLTPIYDQSGLVGNGAVFAANILVDALSPQRVVHERGLGYQISSANLFQSSSGRTMMPYPLNRGAGPPVTYTWRDTAVRALGGPGGAGIPLDVEAGPPLNLEERRGYVAVTGRVPSLGLPLLIEYRCFPSDRGIGLNSLDISLAINSSALPAFRSYSTGGFNSGGSAVQRDPDLETNPRGGFNPLSTPPGQPTPRGDDNSFYIGQLDAVTRISRVHSIWIDTELADPDFDDPIVLPTVQPSDTQVVLEYRGADGFDLSHDLDGQLGFPVDESQFPFDAARLNAYGEIFALIPPVANSVPDHTLLGSSDFPGSVAFVGGTGAWSANIHSIDTARFVQVRITFVSNILTGLSPVLSAIGLSYSE